MTPPRTPLLFVGESPPPDSPSDFTPFDCDSGARLSRLLGLRDRTTLLEHTRRVNIFDVPVGAGGEAVTPPWSDAHAHENTDAIARTLAPRVLVTFGQRVAHAFGVSPDIHYIPHRLPIDVVNEYGATMAPLTCDVIVAPHPFGRSTKLNTVDARREFRRALLVDLVHASPRLTPLDFALTPNTACTRTDVAASREILADLAHVVCPMDPRAGACALRWCVTANITEQCVRALAEWFTRYKFTPIEALRGLISTQTDRRAWGLSNRQDVPGDDLSRAVVLEPTFARACALRWRELRP